MENLKSSIMELMWSMPEDVDQYWEDRVNALKHEIDSQLATGEKIDPVLSSLSELLDESIKCGQYKGPQQDFEETTRVLKIRIKLPRELIEKYFKIKTISMYGVGLFAPVEGLLISSRMRSKMNYDKGIEGKKGSKFDLNLVPEDLRNNYEFRLAIPAMDGLFVPRKSNMTDGWISRVSQIQYFDIMI